MPKNKDQQHKDQRVGVFVDVQNMYHSGKNLYGSNVNFDKILTVAVGSRQLIRAIAYVICSNTSEEQVFFETISKYGFELKIKDLQIFPGGMKKADWDVGIAVDAIKLADKLDVVVLVTGDGDFIPLVRYLKENKGCRVELLSFGRTTSSKLIEEVDDAFDLGKEKGGFLIRKKIPFAKHKGNSWKKNNNKRNIKNKK
ncbi:NYN domain-containing protein [Patescibacteria group bacterium]|nr:NYN domain-containing protein [Patescibacteria group bacterium]